MAQGGPIALGREGWRAWQSLTRASYPAPVNDDGRLWGARPGSAIGAESGHHADVKGFRLRVGEPAAFGGAPHGRLEAAAWLGTTWSGVDG